METRKFHSLRELRRVPYSQIYSPSQAYITMKKEVDEQRNLVYRNSLNRKKFSGYREATNVNSITKDNIDIFINRLLTKNI